jgi:hypothetical protein
MALTGSSSINNMTVASDLSNGSQGLLMPKLQYRFRVNFLNIGNNNATSNLTKQVIDVTRPSVSFGEIPIPIYNSTMYLAGRHEWQALTINLRDDASGTVAALIGQQLQKQMNFYEQASAATGQDYKFQTNIQILDGGNGIGTDKASVLETWECYGCFLQTANYNNLAYSSNDVVTIQLSIRFDNALQTPVDTAGVGAVVGRAASGSSGSVSGVGSPPTTKVAAGTATT